MLLTTVTLLTLATTGLSQIPDGYRAVYITSKVNSSFVVVPTARTSGSGLVVQTAAQTADQQWYIQDGQTSIQLANTTLCVDAGAQSNWKDLASITVADCSATSQGQMWNAMADGRIALNMSNPQECLDLQFGRAVANNSVGIFSCAGLGGIGAADTGINWPLVNATS
ncbi:hypothetical protein F5Y16DRAFT_403885 [Xylariaceae sp. FL0255]|nr:hypothetical protein F5Y16DRAFT_403885 [Xylariaceae sp. FL0255]